MREREEIESEHRDDSGTSFMVEERRSACHLEVLLDIRALLNDLNIAQGWNTAQTRHVELLNEIANAGTKR